MISRREVEHIARLARIELTEEEKSKFEKELSAILDFVAKLNEADTENVEALAGGAELENVMRQDGLSIPRNQTTGQPLIDAAPQKRDGYVEVKAVFEREN